MVVSNRNLLFLVVDFQGLLPLVSGRVCHVFSEHQPSCKMNKRSSAAAMPTMMLRGHGRSRKSVSTALVEPFFTAENGWVEPRFRDVGICFSRFCLTDLDHILVKYKIKKSTVNIYMVISDYIMNHHYITVFQRVKPFQYTRHDTKFFTRSSKRKEPWIRLTAAAMPWLIVLWTFNLTFHNFLGNPITSHHFPHLGRDVMQPCPRNVCVWAPWLPTEGSWQSPFWWRLWPGRKSADMFYLKYEWIVHVRILSRWYNMREKNCACWF